MTGDILPGDILLAILFTGDIIDWRYFAWRYIADDFIYWRYFAWRYIAGDISSVHHIFAISKYIVIIRYMTAFQKLTIECIDSF